MYINNRAVYLYQALKQQEAQTGQDIVGRICFPDEKVMQKHSHSFSFVIYFQLLKTKLPFDVLQPNNGFGSNKDRFLWIFRWTFLTLTVAEAGEDRRLWLCRQALWSLLRHFLALYRTMFSIQIGASLRISILVRVHLTACLFVLSWPLAGFWLPSSSGRIYHGCKDQL